MPYLGSFPWMISFAAALVLLLLSHIQLEVDGFAPWLGLAPRHSRGFGGFMGCTGESRAHCRIGTALCMAAGEEEGKREVGEDEKLLTDDFFLEVQARYKNETVKEALLDKQLYKELRKRRDFGLEQDLYQTLQNRNTSQRLMAMENWVDPLTGKKNMTDILPSEERTPNEVIRVLLEALRFNNEPFENHGIEVFYRFSSPSSATYEFDLDRVADYINSSKYSLLTRWDSVNYPHGLVVSPDQLKAYQTLRLRDPERNVWVNVSFMLSSVNDCWLLDSVLVKERL
ncbi:unnamed protein product [Chrysoparadoxa australica]